MEKFYGPWEITVNDVDHDFQQRFVISGSDNADGRYTFPFRHFVNLVVTGTAWSISFEFVPFPPIPVQHWKQHAVKRNSRFEAGRGLLVQLDTIAAPRLSLICTSMDPTLNPNPTTNPYDFTIPELPHP
jgi:hypothetical protein